MAAAAQLGELPIVDTHAHIFTQRMPLAADAWRTPAREARIEDYLATLDRHHIPFGVIAAASMYGDYNTYTLDALRDHPRLRGTVIASPDTDPYILREMADNGVVGVRWVWFQREQLPDVTSPEYRKFLVRLADLDMHVQLLLGGERLGPLVEAIQKSGVKLVIDHFGFPDPALGTKCPGFQAALRAIDNQRTWVKLAAWHRLGASGTALTQAFLSAAGPERLMWGTDWPFVAAHEGYTYQDAIDAFMTAVPDAGTRRALSETALRFYFWGRESRTP